MLQVAHLTLHPIRGYGSISSEQMGMNLVHRRTVAHPVYLNHALSETEFDEWPEHSGKPTKNLGNTIEESDTTACV